MSSYKELLKQREDLERQINEARQRELDSALEKVRNLVAEFNLTAEDIFAPNRAAKRGSTLATAGTKVAPKYRDPATNQTWTGRGKAPKWIEGQDRSKFAIPDGEV